MLRLTLIALLLLVAAPSSAARTESCPYFYVDSFTTNQAEMDSYSHSPVVDTLVPIYLYSVLMYTLNEDGNRGPGFYQGFEPDGGAILSYRFPLDRAGAVNGGQAAFSIWLIPNARHARMAVSARCQETGRETTAVVTQTGQYEFSLPAIDPCSRVEVTFRGRDVVLDDVHVSLDDVTPVRRSGWGRLKVRYR